MEANRWKVLPRAGITRSALVLAVAAVAAVILLPSAPAQQAGVLSTFSYASAARQPAVLPGNPSALATASTAPSRSSAVAEIASQDLTSVHAQYDGEFGYSVAVSGTTVVVGAPFEKDSVGHAYIMNAKTGVVKTLNTPPADPGGYEDGGLFGFSVAVSGDIVVVGAPIDAASGRGSSAGRAFMFSVTTGDLLSTLVSPNAQGGGDFGTSVAISGTTVVVGAPGATVSGDYGAGHAYTFNAVTGHLISTLASPNAQVGGNFGNSVAVSDATVVVGAPFETASGESEAGRAYTFTAATGGLISTLTSPNSQYLGWFGYSVGVSGATAVVGAPYENALGQVAAGHAYTFKCATGDLISTLASPHAQFYGLFGYSVGIWGSMVTVGAPVETASSLENAGHSYIFDVATGDLISTLSSPESQLYGEFGYSVAVSGTTVVVGAPFESALGHKEAGHAYIF